MGVLSPFPVHTGVGATAFLLPLDYFLRPYTMRVLLPLQRRFVVEVPKLITRDSRTGNKLRINGVNTAVVSIVSLAQAGPPEGQGREASERVMCACILAC